MRDDVEAAMRALREEDSRAHKALRRRLADVERLEQLLRADEELLWLQAEDHLPGTEGKVDSRTIAHGVLALSTKRVLFVGETATGQWEHDALASATVPKTTRGALQRLRVVPVQGDPAWFTLTTRESSTRFLALLGEHVDATEPPAPAGGGSDVEQLQQLTDLHAAGSLSDEEFAAAKARLLGTGPSASLRGAGWIGDLNEMREDRMDWLTESDGTDEGAGA